jgi:hypothetical protein
MQLDPEMTGNTKLCCTLEKRRRKIAEFMTKNCENVFLAFKKKDIRNLQGHPQGEQLHVHAHCIENVFQDTDRGLPENPENQIYQQTGNFFLFICQMSIGEFSCCSKFLEKRELVD